MTTEQLKNFSDIDNIEKGDIVKYTHNIYTSTKVLILDKVIDGGYAVVYWCFYSDKIGDGKACSSSFVQREYSWGEKFWKDEHNIILTKEHFNQLLESLNK